MCNIQNTEISITLVHGQNRFLIEAYFVVDIEELGGVTSRLFHWVWSPTGLPPPLPSSFPENAFRMFWVVPPALRSTIVFWESLLFTLQFGVCALYEYILRSSTFTTAHLNIALRDSPVRYGPFLKNEYFVWMNILDFKKMNFLFEWIFWILKKWIFCLNEYSGF